VDVADEFGHQVSVVSTKIVVSFAFHDQSFTGLGQSGVCHGGVF
jgi:hypothetical protein